MRIGIDATSIPLNRAGAGVYIFQLIKGLARIDIKNEYYIFAKSCHIEEFEINQPNFHFSELHTSSVSLRLLWEQSLLPLKAVECKLDVLHSLHYTMPILKSCKSVVSFPDMTYLKFPQMHRPIHRKFFPAMMYWSAKHSDKIIAISESSRLDAIDLLKVESNKIVTVPLAASSSYRLLPSNLVDQVCEAYKLSKKQYILYVGTLEPRKNIPFLIEGYAKSSKNFPQIPLVLAGKKGWMYDEIFRRVTELGLEEKVRFLNYVPEKDLIALYNGAAAFIYPSFYEGFGLPVLEAMQCGIPVITSNISSMPEVADGAAILINPNSVEEIAVAMRQVLTNRSLVNELSRKGLARSAHFSWKRCAQETLDVYENLNK